jgi:hypothetical protein
MGTEQAKRTGLALPCRVWERESRWRTTAILGVLMMLALAALWWFDPAQTPLPVCGLHAMTGLHCPGCGATRATHELLHGHLLSALRYNVLWIVAMPLAVYLAVSEVRVLSGSRSLPGNLASKPWVYVALGAIAMLFFVLRNLPFHPWLLLAPPG